MIIQPNSIIFDGEKNSYRVIESIGNGSFGFVYKIEKENDKSVWALKTLPSTFPSNEELQSFQNESTLAVKVSHENAINYVFVHDGNEYNHLPPYIIMDYAEAGTVQKIINSAIKESKYLPNNDLYNYFGQLINGMEHINSVLIHRDIKPDNILIQNGTIKISDFGLSKVVHDGTRQLTFKGFGHIKYMAPEGWKREKNTIQMDIYSMGITFYEMATLRHPYDLPVNAEVQDWINAHSFKNPIPPQKINPALTNTMAQIIMKMLEKSTLKRYTTWEEIRNDFQIENEPMTRNSSIIDNMVNIRLQKDATIREEELKKEQEKQEKVHYINTINYQYESEIYNPITEFITEFNKKYTSGHIKITSFGEGFSNDIHTKIHLVSGKTLIINLKVLFDKDFIRDVPSQFDRGVSSKQIVRPSLREKKILAWGYIKSSDNTGFNILLLENKDDLYGEWVTLHNTNSGFSRQQRVEPFGFEFHELEQEIQVIYATHIYNTEVRPLNIEKFYEFIVVNNI
ncbi:serine/threonine-protein kinase [Lysinibacillus capsici]|uniref:serine/threonine-protein kinase n=1 Tax=Lysinibacillus capsici TaxID=2115968 RepID=UPI002E22A396|nr:serine/threonine-protein kinase [Lysinibacillus capsici]